MLLLAQVLQVGSHASHLSPLSTVIPYGQVSLQSMLTISSLNGAEQELHTVGKLEHVLQLLLQGVQTSFTLTEISEGHY